MIEENLEYVKDQIRKSCEKSKRDFGEICLIGVSKTKPLEDLKEAYRAGIRDFGENKVQELVDKIPNMPEDTRFHMIGHLQRNKVKYILDKVFMIHSVDSIRLAEEINKEAVSKGCVVNILVQVNVSGEESKYGVKPEETETLIREMAKLPGLRIRGLMTVAPDVENAEENRCYFRNLKQLSVDIQKKNIDNVCMDVLSMGMTGDYTVAIEEGATYVRVGTGIFGERYYPAKDGIIGKA